MLVEGGMGPVDEERATPVAAPNVSVIDHFCDVRVVVVLDAAIAKFHVEDLLTIHGTGNSPRNSGRDDLKRPVISVSADTFIVSGAALESC
jgi:hypothetical protein